MNPEHVRKCPRCKANPCFRENYPIEGKGMIICNKCGMHTNQYEVNNKIGACKEWAEICDKYLEDAKDTWSREIELKDCPCCGTKPNVVYDQISGKGYIACAECGIRTGESQSLDIVVEIWNKRFPKSNSYEDRAERAWW